MAFIITSSIDEGWYDSNGAHNSGNENTFTGRTLGNNHNSFFAFNVPVTSQPITSAKFRVQVDSTGTFNLDALETISLWDVATPVPTLLAGSMGNTVIYDDLQTGTNFATFTFAPVANDIYEISLSSAAIDALNAARGSTFALGVRLDSQSGKPTEAVRFGAVNKTDAISDLILEVNEAPTNILLSGSTVAEHSASGTAVGTFITVDPNVGDTHTYQLLSDAGGRFGLSADGKSLVVANGAALDFEQTPAHTVTVRSTDPFGLTLDQSLTITLADLATEFGTPLNDILTGGSGRDRLFGLDGNDILSAGAGRDLLVGGRGRDVMTGGSSADVFDFNSIGESARGARRDVITDFRRNVDDIDLRTIDSRTDRSGNNKFKFIGSDAFSEERGELRLKDSGNHVIVQADRNGDGRSDFEILVRNIASLKASDFLL